MSAPLVQEGEAFHYRDLLGTVHLCRSYNITWGGAISQIWPICAEKPRHISGMPTGWCHVPEMEISCLKCLAAG